MKDIWSFKPRVLKFQEKMTVFAALYQCLLQNMPVDISKNLKNSAEQYALYDIKSPALPTDRILTKYANISTQNIFLFVLC